MSRRRTAVAISIVAIGLAACTGHGAAATSEALIPQEPGDLAGTSWTLIGSHDTHAIPPPLQAVLRFTDDAVIAHGPCRAVRLTFTDDGDAVRTHGAASTTILCGAVRLVADFYGRAMENVDTASLESGSLNLTGPHDLRLVFNPLNAAARDVIDGSK